MARWTGCAVACPGFGNLTVAANAYHYDFGNDRRFGWGVDTALSRGPLQIEAEYLNVEYSTLGRTADGWWVSGQWQVDSAWQAVLAVGSYDPDTLTTRDDTGALHPTDPWNVLSPDSQWQAQFGIQVTFGERR